MVKRFSLFQYDFSYLENLICLGLDPIDDTAFRRLIRQSTIDWKLETINLYPTAAVRKAL
jgi:hypothetical protein